MRLLRFVHLLLLFLMGRNLVEKGLNKGKLSLKLFAKGPAICVVNFSQKISLSAFKKTGEERPLFLA